jgi:gamma-glutamyl phosphate reductase
MNAAGLCLNSGTVAVLKGGKKAASSNLALA